MTNERDNVTLTAYAVGELSGSESSAVEARLATDAAARAEVSTIRRVAALLRRALRCEPVLRLAAWQRTAIEARTAHRRRWGPIAAAFAAAAAVLIVAGVFMLSTRGEVESSSVGVTPETHSPSIAPDLARPAPVGSLPPKQADAPVRKGMTALKISLPPVAPGPTPKPIKGEPNFEPPRKGKRPPFLAPKGTVNLARGKPVTSSDPEPIIGELKFVTDGDKQTGDGYFVELAPGKQWVKIDLGQEATIYAIVVWHYHKGDVAYRDVVVQVGKDQDFIEYKTVFNNDHDNSSGQGKGKQKVYMEDYQGRLIDCKGVRGRYVRLWSRENTSNECNHYIEVEVYGKAAK